MLFKTGGKLPIAVEVIKMEDVLAKVEQLQNEIRELEEGEGN